MMEDKYVFLDRDGVINEDGDGWTEHGYITRWEDFRFLPGVPEALKKFADSGYRCVIISNQQGVGKGCFTRRELSAITKRMVDIVKRAGGDIAGVYYCTHTREEQCGCRKPETGLFRQAQEELGISDLRGKYYIGDMERDIQAGKNAGLGTILVLSGKTSSRDVEKWACRPDHICGDLSAAAEIVRGAGS